MLSRIKIDARSNIPKYIQVTESILNLIEDGKLKLGQKLPSINTAFRDLKISRDTLINAYNELRSRGVITPRHGKGFYVSDVSTMRHIKVFVLFDVMNGYKAILYRSLVSHLGENCSVELYFHHYNRQLFENLILSNLGDYSWYVIMPHFNEDVSEVVGRIPQDKLVLIDNEIPFLGTNHAAVFQDFDRDVYASLKSGMDLLKKYKRLFMVMNHEFQFIPDGLVSGFGRFMKEFGRQSAIIDRLNVRNVRKGDAFLVFSDNDLIDLIKTAGQKKFQIGKTIGIISYDETPLKEVLAGGITVISTDFKMMGETAARFVFNKEKVKIANPCQLIRRKSL